jgi:hypothetical protein
VDAPRLGLAARFAPTSVRIYPDGEIDGQGMSLEKFGCVLVRGEEAFGHNRMRKPPDETAEGHRVSLAGTAYDAGFATAYRVGFAKGERHATRGIRVAIDQRSHANQSVRSYAKDFADPEEFERGFKTGLLAGYEDGIEGRPFDTRFGTPLMGGAERGFRPVRKVLRAVKRLIRRK